MTRGLLLLGFLVLPALPVANAADQNRRGNTLVVKDSGSAAKRKITVQAKETANAALAAGLDSFLTSWPGAGHVPYVQHRIEILDQTTNFLYWELDLANAEH
jgi:hypothetical protein